jgi:prepilin-type N-terminal cleavage/methylation domain-containing protein
MVFNDTHPAFSATKRLRVKAISGATLVEMMITITIISIVATAVGAALSYGGRSFAGIVNYIDLDRKSRYALDSMTQEIREATKLKSFQTNSLVFGTLDGADLQYYYSPARRTLVKIKSGVTNTLLTECDKLNFAIFQRTPISGVFAQYDTSTRPDETKVVQVSWTCSRTILGNKMNTESVQTAKIVIRN